MTRLPTKYKKKLIEVAMPLDAINKASMREKSIRHGHPSTLHLWWARRPLAAARAVIWASLVDDPSSHPDEFPDEKSQQKERERLFGILERLVVWENSNNEDVLAEAKAEIRRSMGDDIPEFLDPFAGGGSLPLEAQRLGLIAHARDLNPVAVMINKAMIELPGPFADMPPVNPSARVKLSGSDGWKGTAGLVEDIEYYGHWMCEQAFRRIGHLYPTVRLEDGSEATAIAWLWSRTVPCPNPACGVRVPLMKSFDLSKKKGNEHSVVQIYENGELRFEVHEESSGIPGTIERGVALCPHCGASIAYDYIKDQACVGGLSEILTAVVAEGSSRRVYVTADEASRSTGKIPYPIDRPSGRLPYNPRNFTPPSYGFDEYWKLFTPRQLTMLTTFSDLVMEVAKKAEQDACEAGMSNPEEYGRAIATYLAFVVDKMTDYHSSLCSWTVNRETVRNTFGRQAIPMVWDYAEANPFSSSSGSFGNMLEWVVNAVAMLPAGTNGEVKQELWIEPRALQEAAQQEETQVAGGSRRRTMISTDPPYYDNISYADLSDYFYVWLRRALRAYFPELFRTLLTPKADELIANPYRFDGSKAKAREFFEAGMIQACRNMYDEVRGDIPLTIYYAYKQKQNGEADTGWATMLSAIIEAGFQITGTWPIRTERGGRMNANESNALASSVVLVCRKRLVDAPLGTRREFVSRLRRQLPVALRELQTSNIAPVDMAQSSIGPGMAIFSEYAEVLGPNGERMPVTEALRIINQELDAFLSEQEGALDEASRFCVDLYTQSAFDEMDFGEADVLARAKNTSVDALVEAGVLLAGRGKVRLRPRAELPEDKVESSIWLLTQRLTQAMQEGGISATAEIVSENRTAANAAKDLAYRLYSVAEKKKWQREALAYNDLVSSWPQILDAAAELQSAQQSKQLTML